MRGGRCACQEATGQSCAHQFRISTRKCQQPAPRPHCMPATDGTADLRFGRAARQHIARQQHPSGRFEDVCWVHQTTVAAINRLPAGITVAMWTRGPRTPAQFWGGQSRTGPVFRLIKPENWASSAGENRVSPSRGGPGPARCHRRPAAPPGCPSPVGKGGRRRGPGSHRPRFPGRRRQRRGR